MLLEKEKVARVWAAPSGECVDGIRVEEVPGGWVGNVATKSALYSMWGATVTALFGSEDGGGVQRLEGGGDGILARELQVTGRRFVWAAGGGVLHAQVLVRKVEGTVRASIVEKTAISWEVLKEVSGSGVPMACNLSTYHTLVLYPASVYAYNQISGELTQMLEVWHPGGKSGDEKGARGGDGGRSFLDSPAAGFVRDVVADAVWVWTEDGQVAQVDVGPEEQRVAWQAAKDVGRFDLAMALAPHIQGERGLDFAPSRHAVLEAQADHAAASGDWDAAARLYAKTARPIETVLIDILEACARQSNSSSRNNMADEAVSMRAAFVPSAAANESSESLEAHHGASVEDKVAAKYHEEIEARRKSVTAAAAREAAGDAKQASDYSARLMISYLVSKIDDFSVSQRPSQRAIVATMLVELYASRISHLRCVAEEESSEEVESDFGDFLLDHAKDVHIPTAVSILCSFQCYEQAQKACVLTGDFQRAMQICLLHADAASALALLDLPGLAHKPEEVADILGSISSRLVVQDPELVANYWAAAALAGNVHLEHFCLLHSLARVSRTLRTGGGDADRKAGLAYESAVAYIRHVLCGVYDEEGAKGCGVNQSVGSGRRAFLEKIGGVKGISVASESCDSLNCAESFTNCSKAVEKGRGCVKPLSPAWHKAVQFLFALHAERGTPADAEWSFSAIVISDQERHSLTSWAMRETLEDILQSGYRGQFWSLLASVYSALGLHQEAVSLSLERVCLGEDIGTAPAEEHIAGVEDRIGRQAARALWAQIAAAPGADVLGVAKRSRDLLRVDDALPLMDSFSRAPPDVTNAVAASLGAHQSAATEAAQDGKYTLARTAAIRKDIADVSFWRESSPRLSCGHAGSASIGSACSWCGPDAIESLDIPLL